MILKGETWLMDLKGFKVKAENRFWVPGKVFKSNVFGVKSGRFDLVFDLFFPRGFKGNDIYIAY